MSFTEDDINKATRPKIHIDELEQYKFVKTLAQEVAIRTLSILGNSQGQEVAFTACDQIEVNEGARCEVRSKILNVTKNTPVEVKRDATILEGRTSVLLQAVDGDFNVGFSNTELFFKVTKGNFFEVKLGNDSLRVWVEPTTGTKQIAIAELK